MSSLWTLCSGRLQFLDGLKSHKKVVVMSYESERRVAIESVLQACQLAQKVQSAHFAGGVIGKEDGSPVTVADFGAQAVVSRCLMASFPDDPLVSEEDSEQLRKKENARLKRVVLDYVQQIKPELSDSQVLEAIDRGVGQGGPEGRFWTLDPIDGTKGFLRNDQYAVALALVQNGRVVLGVLGCPSLPLHLGAPQGARGSLFVAVTGEGAAMRSSSDPSEHQIQVNTLKDPSQSIFCESFESSHSSHGDASKVAEQLGTKNPPLRVDSQTKYGILARGDATIYLRLPTQETYRETIWDHAAGSIIVQEAGGKVTDIHGRPLDFSAGRRLNSMGVIASNGQFHDRIVEAVQRVRSRSGEK
jgi:3'(2'), 5'-bisphosphate nucleotidase